MSAGDRMIERLRALGLELPQDARIVPTYAGRHQRNAGAWVWTINSTRGWVRVGSQFPLRELRGPITLSGPDRFGDHFVDPDSGEGEDRWDRKVAGW